MVASITGINNVENRLHYTVETKWRHYNSLMFRQILVWRYLLSSRNCDPFSRSYSAPQTYPQFKLEKRLLIWENVYAFFCPVFWMSFNLSYSVMQFSSLFTRSPYSFIHLLVRSANLFMSLGSFIVFIVFCYSFTNFSVNNQFYLVMWWLLVYKISSS